MFLNEAIGLRTDEGDVTPVQRADLEDRPQLAVLPGEKAAQVSCHIQGATDNGPSRCHRYFFGRPSGRRAGTCGRGLLGHGAGNRSADQVHSADQVDPRLRLDQLLPGEDAPEYVGGRRETDNDDVARVRNILTEQQPHDPEGHLFRRLAVDDGVAPGTGHPVGQEKQRTVIRLQNAARDQPRERLLADFIAPPCRPFKPVAGRV